MMAYMTTLLTRIVFPGLAGLLLLGGVHRTVAGPLQMVCKGKDYFQTGPQQARTVDDTLSVTIDMTPANGSGFNSGTAQVGGYANAMILETPNDKNTVAIIGDLEAKSGLREGSLDRVTGHLYLDFGTFEGLPKSFIGTCRPGKKLF
jgi:hypothetical protein